MVKRPKHRSDELMLIPFLDILCSLIGVLVLIIVVLVVAQTQRINGRTPEEIELHTTLIPARITDPDEAIRNMHEVSGSISIGRPPRKSDYRARWRYNSEIFDDED
jgi:hypothetical protein